MALELAARTRAAFTENLNLKLLSLAFALVLYSLVHGAGARSRRARGRRVLDPAR